MGVTRIPYQDTALPTDSDTFTLVDTTVLSPNLRGVIPMAGWHRFFLSVFANQDGTITEYTSVDGGTNWRQVGTAESHTGSSTAQTTVEYEVDAYRDWRLIWTNGGTNQTTFEVQMSFSTDPL